MNYITYESELYHHGIKGQKWGVRRYQNADGRLTPEGKARLAKSAAKNEIKSKKLVKSSIGSFVTGGIGSALASSAASWLAASQPLLATSVSALSPMVAVTAGTVGAINLGRAAVKAHRSKKYNRILNETT